MQRSRSGSLTRRSTEPLPLHPGIRSGAGPLAPPQGGAHPIWPWGPGRRNLERDLGPRTLWGTCSLSRQEGGRGLGCAKARPLALDAEMLATPHASPDGLVQGLGSLAWLHRAQGPSLKARDKAAHSGDTQACFVQHPHPHLKGASASPPTPCTLHPMGTRGWAPSAPPPAGSRALPMSLEEGRLPRPHPW